MLRLLGMLLLTCTLVLAACGGDDDPTPTRTASASGTVGQSTATAASTSGGQPTATTAPSGDDGDSDDEGNIRVPLSVGSTAETESNDPDPFAADDSEQGTVRITIDAIVDPAETDSQIFQPQPGNKYWAVEVTLEATGDKTVNNGIWYLTTTDGLEYESVYLTGVGDDVIYGAIEPGESQTGFLVFEIPEDAVVSEVYADMSIYVGYDVIFEAQ